MVPGARSALGNSTRREPRPRRSGNASTSPRALCSAGTRSGSTPVRRSASAVAGPTAATSTEPRARASRSTPMKRSTAVTDVRTTQSFSAHGRRRGLQRGAAVRRVDLTGQRQLERAWRPPARARPPGRGHARPRASPPRCDRPAGPGRQRSLVLTECRRRAHDDDGRRPQIDVGQPGQRRPHHPLGCSRPLAMTATAVSGDRPPFMSAAAMAARFVMPMRMTSVPPTRARASQSCSARPVRFADPARHDSDRGGHAALGHRDADRGGDAEGGRHPRHHLPGDAGLRQRLHLLTAAAEEERVPPLETDHDGGRPAVLDQQPAISSCRPVPPPACRDPCPRR